MTTNGGGTTRVGDAFDPIPSNAVLVAIDVIGVPAFSDGPPPDRIPLDRATMEASGFATAFGTRLLSAFCLDFQPPTRA